MPFGKGTALISGLCLLEKKGKGLQCHVQSTSTCLRVIVTLQCSLYCKQFDPGTMQGKSSCYSQASRLPCVPDNNRYAYAVWHRSMCHMDGKACLTREEPLMIFVLLSCKFVSVSALCPHTCGPCLSEPCRATAQRPAARVLRTPTLIMPATPPADSCLMANY